MSVRISSDSTCDLGSELIEKNDIGITPLYIVLGDKTLRDGVECTREDIFAYVQATGKPCSTSAVPVADYHAWFGEQLERYDSVVHFTISAEMSACCQNACIAAEEFPGRVFVVDSRSLSTGIGHLVLDAAELARQGLDGREIKAALDEKKQRLNVSFVLDTLTYLWKGGRCSGVAALGANLLGLKPCIQVRDGVMGVDRKYRGSLKRCLTDYIRDRLEGRDDVDYSRIFITDSGVDPALVRELEALLRQLGPFEEIINTQSGCTISNHCGPRCLGILYYNK